MACEQRGYAMIALSIGLLGAGALSLAIVADYWLFTIEPRPFEYTVSDNSTEMAVFMIDVYMHSGLWRACTYAPGKIVVFKLKGDQRKNIAGA